jgi:SidE phosphodiesterase (PDE) domain
MLVPREFKIIFFNSSKSNNPIDIDIHLNLDHTTQTDNSKKVKVQGITYSLSSNSEMPDVIKKALQEACETSDSAKSLCERLHVILEPEGLDIKVNAYFNMLFSKEEVTQLRQHPEFISELVKPRKDYSEYETKSEVEASERKEAFQHIESFMKRVEQTIWNEDDMLRIADNINKQSFQEVEGSLPDIEAKLSGCLEDISHYCQSQKEILNIAKMALHILLTPENDEEKKAFAKGVYQQVASFMRAHTDERFIDEYYNYLRSEAKFADNTVHPASYLILSHRDKDIDKLMHAELFRTLKLMKRTLVLESKQQNPLQPADPTFPANTPRKTMLKALDTMHCVWLHGSKASTLEALLASPGQSLIPSGELLRRGKTILTGELRQGIDKDGVNQYGLSGVNLLNAEGSMTYSDGFKLDTNKIEDCYKQFLESPWKAGASFSNSPLYDQYYTRFLIGVERMYALDPERVKNDREQIKKVIEDIYAYALLKNFDPTNQKERYLHYEFLRHMKNIEFLVNEGTFSPSTVQSKLATIPLIFASKNKQGIPIYFGPKREYYEEVFRGHLKLGEDISVIFVQKEDKETVRELLRQAGGAANKVTVRSMQALQTAIKTERTLGEHLYDVYGLKEWKEEALEKIKKEVVPAMDHFMNDYKLAKEEGSTKNTSWKELGYGISSAQLEALSEQELERGYKDFIGGPSYFQASPRAYYDLGARFSNSVEKFERMLTLNPEKVAQDFPLLEKMRHDIYKGLQEVVFFNPHHKCDALYTSDYFAPQLNSFLVAFQKFEGLLATVKPTASEHPSFLIESQKPGGSPISIPIANCRHLTLNENNLKYIFKLANQFTLNTAYPDTDGHGDKTKPGASKRYLKEIIHRENHNGVHSACQVRCMQVLFDLVEEKGKVGERKKFHSLKNEEKLSLLLGVYFLGAGRINEESSTEKSNNARSAAIYEAYARQLGVSEKTLQWTKALLVNSCEPEFIKCEGVPFDEKFRFASNLLYVVHHLDLARHHTKLQMEEVEKDLKEKCTVLFSEAPSAISKPLFDFSKKLCAATGTSVKAEEIPLNPSQFEKVSVDGALCWEVVSSLNLENKKT